MKKNETKIHITVVRCKATTEEQLQNYWVIHGLNVFLFLFIFNY